MGRTDVHIAPLGPIVWARPRIPVDYIPGCTDRPHNRPFRTPWVGSAKVPRWDDAATSFRHHGCEGVCPGFDLPLAGTRRLQFLSLRPAIEFNKEPE